LNRSTEGEQHAPAIAIVGDRLLAVWQDEQERADDGEPPGLRSLWLSVAP
jgi:hypothetical protein